MKPDLTVDVAALTMTGGRPKQLKLCREWMRRQDIPRMEHVIVDNPNAGVRDNLIAAMEAAPRARFYAVIEDDDWYPPGYLRRVVEGLTNAQVFGSMLSRYYHLPSGGYREHYSARHASLCCTAWRHDVHHQVLQLVKEQPNPTYIDLPLWKVFKEKFETLLVEDATMVGIKGLAGRPGAGTGHKPQHYNGRPLDDAARSKLREWVGDDADLLLGAMG